jgi:hypothetical protein
MFGQSRPQLPRHNLHPLAGAAFEASLVELSLVFLLAVAFGFVMRLLDA